MCHFRLALLIIALSTSSLAATPPAPTSPNILGAVADLNSGDKARVSKAVATLSGLATGGDVTAMSKLGSHYYRQRDYANAKLWLDKADAAGTTDGDAYNDLGLMFRYGHGVKKNMTTAVIHFMKAAAQGHAEAMGMLAAMHARGDGVRKSWQQAAQWAKKAAEKDSPLGMYVYGYCLTNGFGVEKDVAGGIKLLEKAAKKNNRNAMTALGDHYYESRDYVNARVWYERMAAADSTHSHSMYRLGILYRNGRGVKVDYAKAMSWFRKSAEKGDGLAMGLLGLMYIRGEGVKKDAKVSAEWSRKGAEKGSNIGMYVYGHLLYKGDGVAKDTKTGLEWLEKAAVKGHEHAMAELGSHFFGMKDYRKANGWFSKTFAAGFTGAQAMEEFGTMHRDGLGVKQDYAKAMTWYRKAAAKGDGIAMKNIGFMYYHGDGVTKDRRVAAEWALKAAKKNDKNGMFLYGVLLYEGDGIPKDTKAGIEWLQKSAKLGHTFAKERLAKIGATNKPATVPIPEGPITVAKTGTFADDNGFLFPVRVDGKHGFIDTKGELVVKLEYDNASAFSEGVAALKKGNRWGAIDSKGNVVVPFEFEYLGQCAEGCMTAKSNGRYGYVDRSGKWIIKPQFSHAAKFENGVAKVSVGERSGWLRRDGSWIRKPDYAQLTSFSDGRGMAKVGDKWGLVNEKGEWVVETRFELVQRYHRFTDGLMPVAQGGKWSFIDRDGKWLVEPQFDAVGRAHNGYCPIKKGKLWGLMDLTGKVVVPPKYDSIAVPTESLSQISQKGLTGGFLDIKTGVVTIQPRYRQCYAFEGGLAWVQDSNGDHFYIDRTGSVVLGPFEEANFKFEHGLTHVKEGAVTRVINSRGKTIWQHGESRKSQVTVEIRRAAFDLQDRNKREKAKQFLRQQGKGGNSAAAVLLGSYHFKRTEYAPAESMLKDAIRDGATEAHAMYLLGQMYVNGNSVKVNRKTAAGLFRRAAGLGHPDAMRYFGWLHTSGGDGVRKDPVIAGNWARMAAERGSAAGMHIYAQLLNYGMGIDKDKEAAIGWWKKAASGGLQGARNELKKLGVIKYPRRFSIGVDHRFGFIDASGRIVIKPQYTDHTGFQDGLATVKIMKWDRSTSKSGVIDTDGRFVIPMGQFRGLSSFNEGLCAAEGDNRKKGFIDRQGKWVIKPIYNSGYYFSEGVAVVGTYNHPNLFKGYIKTDGKFLLPFGLYDRLAHFSHGLGWARKFRGRWGAIDKTGKWIFQPQFDAEGRSLGNGRYAVKRLGKRGVIHESGKWVVEPQFEYLGTASRAGLLPVKLDGKWGFIDGAGQWVIKPRFERYRNFNDGFAPVKEGNNWGMINAEGRIVIKPTYEDLSSPSEGLARFWKDKRYGYLDPVTGRVMLPDQYKAADRFSGGVASISNSDASEKSRDYYLIDRYGSIVGGPFKYVDAMGMEDGLVRVHTATSLGARRGYANDKGRIVWSTERKKRNAPLPTGKEFDDYLAARKDLQNNVDTAKAIAFLNLQAKKDNADAMLSLAVFHYKQGDYDKARTYFEEAFTYDVRTGGSYMNILGHIYKRGGKGVKPDQAKAFACYQKSAAKGFPNGMSNLGWMYYHGNGVKSKDYSRALSWGQKSAEENDRDGMYLYGTLLYRGHGVPKADQKAGIEWMQKAARKEHIYAQKSLKELGIKW